MPKDLSFLIFVFQVILAIFFSLLWIFLKKLPDAIHQKAIKSFEFQLQEKLEMMKAGLAKEVELWKINQTDIQVHKTKEFVRLIEYFNEALTNKKKLAKLASDEEEQENFNKNMLNLGVKLFFFASDETVKKYVEWRRYGLRVEREGGDKKKILLMYAGLVVSMRKDLGYFDTKCDQNDFLFIMLKDWENEELRLEEKMSM